MLGHRQQTLHRWKSGHILNNCVHTRGIHTLDLLLSAILSGDNSTLACNRSPRLTDNWGGLRNSAATTPHNESTKGLCNTLVQS